MQLCINSYERKTSFGSKNRFIRPFQIDSSQGPLHVCELKSLDSLSEQEQFNLTKFFIDNCLESCTDPSANRLRGPSGRNKLIAFIYNYLDTNLKQVFHKDDGNSTVLIAKDSKGKIQAGIIAHSFNNVEGIEDDKTFFVDVVAVDKKYRHNRIGKTLIDKVTQTARGLFTDIILVAYNPNVPFYSKLGFRVTDQNNPAIKAIISSLQTEYDDVPEYSQLMEKTLEPEAIRWWQRLLKRVIT